MNKKMRAIILAVGIMILAIPAVQASPESEPARQERFKDKHRDKREELFKELNLTEEQRQQLEANKTQNRKEMKTLFEGMREKRSRLQQELQADNINMDKVNQINGELKVLQGQMLDHRLAGILAVRKILSPEQFKKFMSKMEERKQHAGPRWQEDKEGPEAIQK